MKKKLIFVNEALWIGGIETALVNLLNHLDYDKYDVTCLILRDYQELVEQITPQCKVLIVDRHHTVSFKEAYKCSRLFNILEEPQNASSLRRIIWKVSCWLFRSFEVKLYAKYIREQLNQKFDTAIIYSHRVAELTVRGINTDKYIMFYHHGEVMREYHDIYGYAKSEKIVAVSDRIADALKRSFPAYAEKIVRIHNLTDVDSIRKKAEEQPNDLFSAQGINIVSCGRLHPAKGYDLAMEACAKLISEGYDFNWYLVGGGSEEETLRRKIIQLGMEGHIHLYGMKNNPYPYIKAADLFIQPSRYEGCSLTIYESQLLGVPVLATNAAVDGNILDPAKVTVCEVSVDSIAQGLRAQLDKLMLNNEHVESIPYKQCRSANAEILEQLERIL